MYYLYCFARILVLNVPRRVAYWLASFCAGIKFYISKSDRDTIIYNLLPVLKNKKAARLAAKKVFENFAFYLVDFFRYSKLDLDFIAKYVTLQGLDNLNHVAVQKRGAVVLSAHLGNYELGASIISLLKYPIHVIALSHQDRRINDFFDHQRNIFGVGVIPLGQSIRKCLTVLKEGAFVAFLGDRSFGPTKKTKVSMFGKTAFLPNGPAFFALKTNSFVLPCFIVRENKYYYRFIFKEPIEYNADNGKGNVEEIIKDYSKVLEEYISKYPEQWYMFERCWVE